MVSEPNEHYILHPKCGVVSVPSVRPTKFSNICQPWYKKDHRCKNEKAKKTHPNASSSSWVKGRLIDALRSDDDTFGNYSQFDWTGTST